MAGSGRIGFSSDVFEAELFAGGGEGVRAIARPVISHDPFDGDAEASVVGERGFQMGDGAVCFLIGEHACMDAGGRAASGTSRRGRYRRCARRPPTGR